MVNWDLGVIFTHYNLYYFVNGQKDPLLVSRPIKNGPSTYVQELVLLSFQTIGSLLLYRRTHSPCHRWPSFYDLGCGSASNRRRCPCFVVGFRLPLDLCFVLLLVSW